MDAVNPSLKFVDGADARGCGLIALTSHLAFELDDADWRACRGYPEVLSL